MTFYVVKRNGRRESVHFDKITSRVSKLCYGLNSKVRRVWPVASVWGDRCWCAPFLHGALHACLTHTHTHTRLSSLTRSLIVPIYIYIYIFQHVDPVIISQKVIQGVYPGVTTSELDE